MIFLTANHRAFQGECYPNTSPGPQVIPYIIYFNGTESPKIGESDYRNHSMGTEVQLCNSHCIIRWAEILCTFEQSHRLIRRNRK